MERNAKKVLDKLRTIPGHSCVYEGSFDYHGGITFIKMSDEIKLSLDELQRVLEYLEKQGYVSEIKHTNLKGYILTHEGIHYRYFGFEKMMRLIIESVLVPVAVSFITTAIINLLQLTQ